MARLITFDVSDENWPFLYINKPNSDSKESPKDNVDISAYKLRAVNCTINHFGNQNRRTMIEGQPRLRNTFNSVNERRSFRFNIQEAYSPIMTRIITRYRPRYNFAISHFKRYIIYREDDGSS